MVDVYNSSTGALLKSGHGYLTSVVTGTSITGRTFVYVYKLFI